MTKQMAATLFVFRDDVTGDVTATVVQASDQAHHLPASTIAGAFRQMATYVEAEAVAASDRDGRISTSMSTPDNAAALPNESLRAKLARARSKLDFAGALRRENGTERIVDTFAPTTDILDYRELRAEAERRGMDTSEWSTT